MSKFRRVVQLITLPYYRFTPLSLQIQNRKLIQRLKGYQEVPDARTPIEVDIDNIRYRSKSRFIPEKRYIGKVIGGEWDKDKECIKKTVTFQGLREHFIQGKDWKSTIYYQHAIEKIKSAGEFYGCTSQEEFIETRCEFVDRLYNSIQNHGLQYNPTEVPFDSNRPWSYYDPTGISILIGRQGELLLHDGTHRLSIAKIQGISQLKVTVLIRHTHWQDIRERYYKCDSEINKKIDHPDLHNFEQ